MRNPPSLRSGRDFRRVLAEGRRVARNGLVASALASRRPEDPSRLGLAVRCSSAVARNRVKRRLRAAFVQVGPVGGYDVVVQADGSLLDMEFSNLVKDLRIALDRVTGGEQ